MNLFKSLNYKFLEKFSDYDENQLYQIKLAMRSNKVNLKVLINPDLSYERMNEIRLAYEDDIPEEDIKLYLLGEKYMPAIKMRFLRMALREKFSDDKITLLESIDYSYNIEELYQIIKEFKDDSDFPFELLMDDFDSQQLMKIKNMYKKGYDKNFIALIANSCFNVDDMSILEDITNRKCGYGLFQSITNKYYNHICESDDDKVNHEWLYQIYLYFENGIKNDIIEYIVNEDIDCHELEALRVYIESCDKSDEEIIFIIAHIMDEKNLNNLCFITNNYFASKQFNEELEK